MSAKVGTINSLSVCKEVSFGVYLDGGDLGEILLPKRYVPEGTGTGSTIDVFVHHDSEDRLIATTDSPKVMVGQCAFLKVQSVARFGAFVDWGLPKDLLVPGNQQNVKMEPDYRYVVYAYIDKRTGRIAGSTKLSLFLSEQGHGFKVGQRVDLLIAARSDLGFKAVINNTHLGLIFHEEVQSPLKFGARMPGYIKRIRKDDLRIDLALDAGRATTRGDLNRSIIDYLKQQGGVSDLTDRASADRINALFGVSKGNFKKALGALYRARQIVIAKDEIKLVRESLNEDQQDQSKNKKKWDKPSQKSDWLKPGREKKTTKAGTKKPAIKKATKKRPRR